MDMSLVLNDEQLAHFDVEYVNRDYWTKCRQCIEWDFPDGEFSILDVGGGNGKFADRVLMTFPKATATVVDLSEMLLGKNLPNPRKTTLIASATELDKLTGKYDIVSFNWVLHHLIGKSYAQSLENIRDALKAAQGLLTPRGHISIYDNLCDGVIFDRAPSRIIYELTSSKLLAKIVKAGGANTAGVGVCFQSYKAWKDHFRRTGLKLTSFERYASYEKPLRKRAGCGLALHMRPERPGHFWLDRMPAKKIRDRSNGGVARN